jgi:hypothetical protein
MDSIHARLASKLHLLPGPAVLIALAETATGLGHGIYEHLLTRTGRRDLLFLHTTRYRLDRALALSFEESHSHATEHLLYEPSDPHHAGLFRTAQTVVLVDDEVSTGRTLANLTSTYCRLNPRLASVQVVSLTDWLSPERRGEFDNLVGVPVEFHSLLRGRFAFEEDARFDPGAIPNVSGRGDAKDAYLRGNFGRLGLCGPLTLDLDALASAAGVQPGERVLVLGTGEFSHAPFCLARFLQERGWDVLYQSTTRSPLLLDGDLSSVLEFIDNYFDEIPNYLYNVIDKNYDRVVIGYETQPLPETHRLAEKISAVKVVFANEDKKNYKL